ncbi:hypothetical protein [Gymnodinialimonas hymeniacidonis]|uniref:hypothetical protein n=1 Tax=Gymnodinialimonas hymeniacidonis TaxID=3126508 RepID=UPI0034C66740
MSGPFSEEDWSERPDWPLAQNGATNLFFRETVLDEAIADLKALDYAILEVNCETMDTFLYSVSVGFDWQNQFGYQLSRPNLDAINDGLRTPPFPTSKRLAVVGRGIDRLKQENERFTSGFLDIFEYQARDALLFGGLMLGLFQANDPLFSTDTLGGRAARFNPKEWLNASRGV